MSQFRYTGRSGVFPMLRLLNNSVTDDTLYVTEICHHCHTPKEYQPHTTKDCCIHVILSGSVKINGIILTKGYGYFHRDDQYSIDRIFDEEFEEVSIQYSGMLAHSFSKNIGLTGKFRFIKINNNVDFSFLKNAVYADYENLNQSLSMLSTLYALAASILINATNYRNIVNVANPAALNNNHIIEGLKFIEKNFTEQITISDLAKHLSLSPNHVCKLFKTYTGKTPQQVLLRYRMDTAQKLLSNSNYPIMDIAEFVGYLDNRHFSQVFRKTVGYTPTRYRKLTSIKDENWYV